MTSLKYLEKQDDEWVWKYFANTEAKEIAECKHCHLYFRCLKTEDLYRHLMINHWHIVQYNIIVHPHFADKYRIWVLTQFSEYTHVSLCKICGITINYKQYHALGDHLLDHGINKKTKVQNIQMDPTYERLERWRYVIWIIISVVSLFDL